MIFLRKCHSWLVELSHPFLCLQFNFFYLFCLELVFCQFNASDSFYELFIFSSSEPFFLCALAFFLIHHRLGIFFILEHFLSHCAGLLLEHFKLFLSLFTHLSSGNKYILLILSILARTIPNSMQKLDFAFVMISLFFVTHLFVLEGIDTGFE